jgi:hypothetical protein
MTWAMRLRRVFNIDITECEKCQKQNVSIIACIIGVFVINRTLAHLDKKYPVTAKAKANLLPPLRATPETEQQDFDWVSPNTGA